MSSHALGPDGIVPTELKMAADQIALLLTILFNESLATGILPNKFKVANLFPLLKKIRNYLSDKLLRNLSHLHQFQSSGKLVLDQLHEFLNKRSALSVAQFGFRRGYSYENLFLRTVNDWLLAKDAKNSTAVVLSTIQKRWTMYKSKNYS